MKRLFGKSEDKENKNPWVIEASQGIAKSYYTYFCARFDFRSDSTLSQLQFEVWSGAPSRICWLGVGTTGLYAPNVYSNSPEELAKQLYLHEKEIREKGENIIFKNQVPPTYSDLVLRHYIRTPISQDLVFKVFLEMNRLNELNQK